MDDKKVVVSRVFNAPIEKVFKAWVDAEQMKKWYSPEGMTTPDAGSEQKKDGRYHVTMHMGEQEFKMQGTYLEYDEPNKLVFTWEASMSEDNKPTTVTISFKTVQGNKAEVRLIHSGFADEGSRAQHDQGWIGTFNKLEKYLSA